MDVMSEMKESRNNMAGAKMNPKGKLSMSKGKMHKSMAKHKGKSGMRAAKAK